MLSIGDNSHAGAEGADPEAAIDPHPGPSSAVPAAADEIEGPGMVRASTCAFHKILILLDKAKKRA